LKLSRKSKIYRQTDVNEKQTMFNLQGNLKL